FLSVFGNDALANFQGLEALQAIQNDGKNAQALAIGLDFDDDGNPVAAGNANLQDLTAFDILQTGTNGDLFIGFNQQLQNFNGIDNLVTLGGDLVILGSTMQDFAGADVLATINGNFILGQVFGNDDQVRAKVLDVDNQLVDPRVTVNLDVNNNGN